MWRRFLQKSAQVRIDWQPPAARRPVQAGSSQPVDTRTTMMQPPEQAARSIKIVVHLLFLYNFNSTLCLTYLFNVGQTGSLFIYFRPFHNAIEL